MADVGFIGLGTMGGPMARNLLKHGHRVALYDVSDAAMRRFDRSGARLGSSPADVADGAEFVITMLPGPPDVHAAVLGSGGAATSMRRGSMLIEMSTGSPAKLLSMATELSARGIDLIDAPVGRSPWNAEEGTLLIMAGGPAESLARARAVLECMGNEVVHAGPLGSGIKLKLVNNYLAVVGTVAVAEALVLAEKAGLQTDLVVRVMQGTVAGRGALNVLYPLRALKGDLSPIFSMRLAHKDLSLALELGAELAAPLALGGASREILGLGPAWDRMDQDMTAVLPMLEDIARVSKPREIK